MDENAPSDASEPSAARGWPLVAWLVVALVVLVTLLAPRQALRDQEGREETPRGGLDTVVFELQMKYVVGAANLVGTSDELYEQSQTLNTGPVATRLRFATVAGELAGAEEARKELDALRELIEEHETALAPTEEATLAALDQLYQDYERKAWAAPSLSDEQRSLLRSDLGWFGQLALSPRKGPPTPQRQRVIAEAKTTTLVMVGFVGAGFCGFLLGFAGFVGFAAAILAGQVHSRLGAGSPFGGLYAEAFAVWLVAFVALQIAVALVVPEPLWLPVNGVMFFVSLLALGWPVIRGAPWKAVRREIGWTWGERPWLEVLCGIGCYLASLPLVALGVLGMLALAAVAAAFTGPSTPDPLAPPLVPGHPIVQSVVEGGFAMRALVILLACVAAPVVEEATFRGLLYRHVRDATAHWRIAVSVVVSAAVTSLVFAALHPQGVLAIPPLMALAFGFSLAREWRGSLVAPMTAHALNNGIVATLLMLLV